MIGNSTAATPTYYRQTEDIIRNSVFWIPATISLVFVSLGAPGLPDKYRLDSYVIQQAASGVREVDSAYQFIANIYSTLTLSSSVSLSAFASLVPFLTIQGLMYFTYAPKRVTLQLAIFVIALDVVGSVYLGQMTKELFMLIIPASFLMFLRFPKFAVVSVVMPAIVVALQMRSYWFIVASLFLALHYLSRRGKKLNLMVSIALLVLAFYVVPRLFYWTQNFELEEVRLGLNLTRIDSELAQTSISVLFDFTNPMAQFVNLTIILASFAVPVPLLLTSNPVHVLFAGFILYLSFSLIFATRYLRAHLKDEQTAVAYNMLITYLLTQAIFEPDYGSFLRHMTPLLLLGFYLVLKKEAQIGSEKEQYLPTESSEK